eukprot:2951652-Prymnesium_polylepis.1
MRQEKRKDDTSVVEEDKDGIKTYSLAERAQLARAEEGLVGENEDDDDKKSLAAARKRRDEAKGVVKPVGPQRGRGNHWVEPEEAAREEAERWEGIERHPSEGRPLVILAHGALGHARGAHEL